MMKKRLVLVGLKRVNSSLKISLGHLAAVLSLRYGFGLADRSDCAQSAVAAF
jgi:hypothetical protein